MAAQNMAQVLDEAEVVVEDTVEILEARLSWVANPKVLMTSALLAGVVIGSAATYLVVKKKLESKIRSQADSEIEDVKAHYLTFAEKPSLADLASEYPAEEQEADLEEAVDILTNEGYTSYDRVPVVTTAPEVPFESTTATRAVVEAATQDAVVVRNAFESDSPDTYFDLEEELKRREERPDQPFVITLEEFNNNETEYEQSTLTYYDGDDVLADQKDAPIDDIDMVIGFENVLRFGHGSGDPNIVYIRNNKLTLDFEVTFSPGKFSKEVLGFQDGELQHSHRRPDRKFRLHDE